MATTQIEKPMTTAEVSEVTGWSLIKIRKLIAAGRLKAINTSTGERPRWTIRPSDLREFLEPKLARGTDKAKRRKRLDSDVAKVF